MFQIRLKRLKMKLKLNINPRRVHMDSSSIEIGRIQKNKTTSTLVQLTEFKGQKYMDIREFFTTGTGEFIPTKKGVSIPVSKLSDIVTLVEKCEAKSHEQSIGV
jgi:hypothetical protein